MPGKALTVPRGVKGRRRPRTSRPPPWASLGRPLYAGRCQTTASRTRRWEAGQRHQKPHQIRLTGDAVLAANPLQVKAHGTVPATRCGRQVVHLPAVRPQTAASLSAGVRHRISAIGFPAVQDGGEFGSTDVGDGESAFVMHRIAHPMTRTAKEPVMARARCKAKRREET